eukprot:3591843-Rhodomonas_salina.1
MAGRKLSPSRRNPTWMMRHKEEEGEFASGQRSACGALRYLGEQALGSVGERVGEQEEAVGERGDRLVHRHHVQGYLPTTTRCVSSSNGGAVALHDKDQTWSWSITPSGAASASFCCSSGVPNVHSS